MTTITQKRTTKTMADVGHQRFTKSVFYTPYPGIQFRLPCTPPPPPPPPDNFSWVPNCSLGPPGWETKVSLKTFWFGLCEIAWFLCQPIANLRRGSAYKITHISAVTYPRLLNLIPNQSLDICLISPCCIWKLSNLHIHKYL